MKLSAEIIENATRAYWHATAAEYQKRDIPHVNLAYDYLCDDMKQAERAGIVAAIKSVVKAITDDESVT